MRVRKREPRCPLRSPAVLASLLALLALALPGTASASKHRAPQSRYVVSLAGSLRLEWSETEEGLDESGPPLDCLGHGSETLSFTASAQIATKPMPSALAYYGRNFPYIVFKAALNSLSARGSLESAGSFAPDVTEPYPPSAAECAFTPKRTAAKCAFDNHSALEAGEYFDISPELDVNPTAPLQRGNRFFIYEGQPLTVECDPARIYGDLLGESVGVPTTLRVGAILALRKGKSLRDSGSASFPWIGASGKPDGTQTVAFSIAVRRVR